MSFLSAKDSQAEFQIDEHGGPVWQKFVLYYYDEPESVIRRTEVPYSNPIPSQEQTIEVFSSATLESFIGFGTPQPVADGISFCRWEAITPGRLEFEIETQRARYQGEGVDKKRLNGRLYSEAARYWTPTTFALKTKISVQEPILVDVMIQIPISS